MRRLLWLLLVLLPACSKAEENDCASLPDTAIGAALGDSDHTYNLGVAFYAGRCVKKSYENAAVMWEKAAASGVISAKNNLGYLLSQGLGTKRDEARAIRLWREAARQGHAESQVHLGEAMFYGRGVAKDQMDGLAWVLRAEDSAISLPDIGGGPAITRLAQDAKRKMLLTSPGLLRVAAVRSAQLEVGPGPR